MGFFRDLEDDIKELGRDIDDNILQPIKENPIGAIVSVGGMALGIPPVYAGALGGAAGAAASGGDILKGAVLGGVGGYVGGAASGAAANAGAGTILSSAAGGAAAGAAGAALTGGDILKGALYGGVMGAGTGALRDLYTDINGNKVYQYDDGSTITRDGNGNAVASTPSTDGSGAPVYEYNPSTGRIEAFNPDGQLKILSVEETNALMSRVDPALRNSLVEGGEVFRVEVEGLPGTAENAGYARAEFRTPGTELATFDQIDAGQANWNPAANAWEIDYSSFGPTETLPGAFGEAPLGTPGLVEWQGPETYTFDDGSTFSFNADGTTSFTDAITGANRYTDVGSVQSGGAGGATYTFDDGTWLTINPDGSSVWTDTNGTTHTSAGGTYSGAGTGGAVADLGEITITAPREPTTDLGEIEISAPRDTGGFVAGPGPTTGGDVTTPISGGEGGWTTPVTPVFPVVTPGGGSGGGGGGGTPTTPGGGSPISNLQTNFGLNPGWIAPTPFYNTTDPVQSQFSWGARPFQAGPTFNPTLYNQAAAPMTPWGIQQGFRPLTPEEAVAASRGEYEYQPTGAPAVRVTPYAAAPVTPPASSGPPIPVDFPIRPPGGYYNTPPQNTTPAPIRPPGGYYNTPAPTVVVGPTQPVVGPTSPFVIGPA